MARYRQLTPGDHAPWFRQACTSNPDYHFDTVGGRYVVLCFFLTAGDSLGQEMVATMESLTIISTTTRSPVSGSRSIVTTKTHCGCIPSCPAVAFSGILMAG